jgi:serine/threonine protein kinase
MTLPGTSDPWVEAIRRHRLICGRYADPEPLGDGLGGSFSLTFGADDRVTGERVVLKFLKPGLENHYRGECFRREIEVARALKGRGNIVQSRGGLETLQAQILIHGVTVPLPLSFYALERGNGTLAEFLLGRKPPGLRRRLEVIRDLIKGVNRLHLVGYCHRDVKPDNVVLFSGGVGKVSDFGTCRCLDRDEPAFRVEYDGPHGDVGYTAPEIIMGGWNRRSLYLGADWFSVGSVLFESLTGMNLYIHVGLQNDISSWLATFQAIPDTDRLRAFEHHVTDIAGRYPVPSIREFQSSNLHLQAASSATLGATDRLVEALCHFDHRRRLCRFEDVLRAVDIALGHACLDERRRSALMMRGLGQALPALVSRTGRV